MQDFWRVEIGEAPFLYIYRCRLIPPSLLLVLIPFHSIPFPFPFRFRHRAQRCRTSAACREPGVRWYPPDTQATTTTRTAAQLMIQTRNCQYRYEGSASNRRKLAQTVCLHRQDRITTALHLHRGEGESEMEREREGATRKESCMDSVQRGPGQVTTRYRCQTGLISTLVVLVVLAVLQRAQWARGGRHARTAGRKQSKIERRRFV